MLEPFDDSEFEKRVPTDYLSGVASGDKDGVLGKALQMECEFKGL